MKNNYLDIYNNFIKLTTNKSLYKGLLGKQDDFSDRLTLFLIHFIFRQLELSIREIGYGDQSINKKMKDYINIFHGIVSEIHFWNKLEYSEKEKKISLFLTNFKDIGYLIGYFEDFRKNLAKKNLKSFLKSVSKQ